MKDKVQIINYREDGNFQDRYNQIECEPKLPFRTLKLGPTLDPKILKLGAKESIDYYNQRWNHISGLFPIKGISNVFHGDLFGGDTIGIWLQPTKENISIVIFLGHRPKFRKSREKKVNNYIREQKK